MFNAMPSFTHRAPGIIGAAFDFASHVEIISDGVHLHPSVIRAVFRMFGNRRICLISDSTRGTGMPDGEYELGGQAITLKDGRSNLVNGGTIAGSAMNLTDCFRYAVKSGIPLEDAVQAAACNPARAAGIDSAVGSLEPGKHADILIMDDDLHIIAVFVGGKRIV
jgi:N-acetylglucosamine-6-phosphate deacetylase